MMVAKSATDAAAMTSWPKVLSLRPASLSTGMTTPSEVAERTIARKSASSTTPVTESSTPMASAIANETTKPPAATPAIRPRRRS